jgi:predicted SAM-dependent methyltransferase
MKLLNFGCGSTFHPAWVNIDIASSSPEVREYDIRKNLPYPNAEFDACYSSHVLEHLKQHEAQKLLAECHRVLKPKGIIRIKTGFIDVRVCRADESRIPDFNIYNLDVVEGKIRKPDSLFMEGIKP